MHNVFCEELTPVFPFQTVSTLVNGMRRIYIPQELISRFLTLASMNTSRNLETCGILTGKLVSIFQSLAYCNALGCIDDQVCIAFSNDEVTHKAGAYP